MSDITRSQLRISIERAKIAFEKYQSWGGGLDIFPRQIPTLGKTFARDLEAHIEICDLPNIPAELRDLIPGLYRKVNNQKYEIYVHPTFNTCYQNLIGCKELFHAFLDAVEYQSIEVEIDLEKLTKKSLVSVPVVIEDEFGDNLHPPGSSEQMAQLAAMEFMFPFKKRIECKDKKNIVLYDVAYEYRIPEKFVKHYLSDEMMALVEPYSK